MRPLLKLYIALVGTAAILLLGHDLSVLPLWPHAWSLEVTIALIVLTAIGAGMLILAVIERNPQKARSLSITLALWRE